MASTTISRAAATSSTAATSWDVTPAPLLTQLLENVANSSATHHQREGLHQVKLPNSWVSSGTGVTVQTANSASGAGCQALAWHRSYLQAVVVPASWLCVAVASFWCCAWWWPVCSWMLLGLRVVH